ncbi:MAG TPA: hypothetical protein VMH35_01290 [Streptosporangiaceae bacterium]|nr:hypothetical protein [Streptosporangiaceae bacterium]
MLDGLTIAASPDQQTVVAFTSTGCESQHRVIGCHRGCGSHLDPSRLGLEQASKVGVVGDRIRQWQTPNERRGIRVSLEHGQRLGKPTVDGHWPA